MKCTVNNFQVKYGLHFTYYVFKFLINSFYFTLLSVSLAITSDANLLRVIVQQYTSPLELGNDVAGFALMKGFINDENDISHLQVDETTSFPLEGQITTDHRQNFVDWFNQQENYDNTVPYYNITSMYMNNEGDIGDTGIQGFKDSFSLGLSSSIETSSSLPTATPLLKLDKRLLYGFALKLHK